jgi:hypothetical protein
MKLPSQGLRFFIFFYLIICSINISLAQSIERGINLGLAYPVSTNGRNAHLFSNVFSLNLISGVSKEEQGFTFAGIFNLVDHDARGFQVAGIFNRIGGMAEGFKVAGIFNCYDSGYGFQAGGLMNLAFGDVTGFQAAGLYNRGRNINGFQAAGFVNTAENVTGMQGAGFMNIAADVKGSQFSGFMNVAKKVKGVQGAGFINIADSSDYPIGIINLIKNGEKFIGWTIDDNLTTMITFRSGSQYLYGILGLGINPRNPHSILARQYGLGAHVARSRNFRLNTEYTMTSLENFRRGDFQKHSVALHGALKINPKFEVFGGPAFNYVSTNSTDGRTVVDHYMWRNSPSHERLRGFYVGFSAGVQMSI